MAKYFVKACPNCIYHNVDKKHNSHSCENGYEGNLEDWYEQYGRRPQRDWCESMDLECYEPNKKSQRREEMKESLSDFMSDLNNMLNN